MKSLIALFTIIMTAQLSFGQGVGVGTNTPAPSAKLDVSSTTQGMLVPRMTTAQRALISSPATGLLVFDTNTNSFWFKGGTTWVELIDSSNTVVHHNGPNVYMGINGNVGIGTDAPMSKLEVMTPTDSLGITHTDGTVQLSTKITDTSAVIMTTTDHELTLQAGPSGSIINMYSTGGISMNSTTYPSGPPLPGTTLQVEGKTSLMGLLGVGTELPTAKLDVKTEGSLPAITLRDETVKLTVKMETDKAVIKTETASALQLNANNGTDQFTIATSGMVGIGNPSPELPLSFANTYSGKIALKKTAASYYGFGVSPSALLIHSDGPGSDILFGYHNGAFAELARLSGTGRFGIGTNNPMAMLSVIRGTSPDGTAAFNGTTFNSYFNKSTNENTSINGGKAGSNVLINADPGLGFVGIGTTSPTTKLDVNGDLHVSGGVGIGGGLAVGVALGIGVLAPSFPLEFSSTNGDKIALSGNPGAMYGLGVQPNLLQVITPNTSADIGFGTGSSSSFNEKMRLTGDGDLGIGTESPSTKLDVNGDANISGGLAVGLGVAIGGGLGVGGTVGVGTQSPDQSAVLDLTSTDKGLLMPRMSSTQREDIDSPAEGLTVYDMTTNSPWFHDENSWEEMKSDSFTSEVIRNGPDMIYMGLTDSVGIGTSTPDYKLQVVTGDNMYGISHTNGDVDIVTRVSSANGGGIGTKTTDQFELFANGGANQLVISPSGNVGVGLAPSNKLDIAGAARTGSHPFNLPLYVTGNVGTNTNGMEVRSNDGTQGVGIGSNTIYAAAPLQDLRVEAKGATGMVKIATNGIERMFVTGPGNVGIGTSTPNAPLQFANPEKARKIVLYEKNNNDNEFSGFGTDPFPNQFSMRYQVFDSLSSHTFYSGINSNTSRELMRITGTGKVGIGVAAPSNKLDVATANRTGTHPSSLLLYMTGNLGANTNGMEIRKSDGTQGIGIGSTTIYGTGAIQDLRLEAKGATGNMKLLTNGLDRLVILGNGNVGLGTIAPNAPLQFNSVEATRKIVLYEGGNNDNQFFGFGINASALRYQAIGDHVFYGGTSATTSKELMRMTFGGNLGIGIPAPLASLEAARGTGANGTMMLYGTTYNTNFNQGTTEHTFIRGGKANSNVIINELAGLGNVGIGTPVPLQKLHVEGNTYISQNLGIGTNLPNAPLQFASAQATRKIVLYEGGNDDNQFFGFGVNASALRYQAIGDHVFYFGANSTTSTELMRMTSGGNLGIGTATPHAPLQFSNTVPQNRKIVLYEGTNNDHQFYGLGVNGGILRYQVSAITDNHVFYAGSSPTTSDELMRIQGNGNVGIKVSSPANRLDVQIGATRTGSQATGRALYVTADLLPSSNGIEFRHNNGTQGIGFGYNTIYAAGSDAAQNLGIQAKGTTGNVSFTTNGNERMRVAGDGNVGIGLTSPNATLEIARGTGIFGTLQADGTTYNSHFNYGSPEDTYIRGGKAGAKVIINDYGDQGNVGIGTANPLQKLHVGGKLAVDNNVGIGNTDPHAPLQFNNADASRKIVLQEFGGSNNDYQFTGFGSSTYDLRYQVGHGDASHIFYAANAIPSSVELMRITGWGTVGIGTASPTEKLEVNGNAKVDGNIVATGELKIGFDGVHLGFPVPIGTIATVYSCDCPPGTFVMSGGWVGPGLDVIGSFPDPLGTKWDVMLNNLSPVPGVITVYANCARIGY